jgi:hypothetical protein
VLIHAFYPELEGGDRPGVERRGQPLREIAADVGRRDQIELAGRPVRVALEALDEIGIEIVFHRLSAPARTSARPSP